VTVRVPARPGRGHLCGGEAVRAVLRRSRCAGAQRRTAVGGSFGCSESEDPGLGGTGALGTPAGSEGAEVSVSVNQPDWAGALRN
jgi:hypothetical protein